MHAFGIFLLLLSCVLIFVSSETYFIYNGFEAGSLNLDGSSSLRQNGILTLTNSSSMILGHAFYPSPLPFKSRKNKSTIATFSTTFVFSMVPKYPDLGGHGLAFILITTKQPKGCLPNQFLGGLPNETSVREFSTSYLAVEFDTVQNLEFEDVDDNHVGIDFSSLVSNVSKSAVYYSSNSRDDTSKNITINLKSGEPIQAWIDYNEEEKLINVTISPFGMLKPYNPLISFPVDLSTVLSDYMYAAFSASNGLLIADNNIHGWSFKIGGKAQELYEANIPLLGSSSSGEVVHRKSFAVGITLASVTLFIFVVSAAIHVLRRIGNENEILQDWEVEYGAHRFKYSELHLATMGFGEKNIIGYGGFGIVYREVIPRTGLEVAVKRVAPDSRQGMKEFAAEITRMGRLRHRNLVQLHGWSRKKDELLLVYDFVPNGSLDKLLFENEYQKKKLLTWNRRYKILTGVAQALLYLHEECDQWIVHRDVKPSNVPIDADFQPKLGDFGLARTYGHGINPQTTQVVGTLGYIAPELTRTGKSTTSTDVYGYGIPILAVASGRQPIEPQKNARELVLVDWVRELYSQGDITRAIDPSLDEYDKDEAELVLILGLLCSHPHPDCRPNIRRIVELLLRDASLPPLPVDIHCDGLRPIMENSDNFAEDSPSSSGMSSSKNYSLSSFDKMCTAKPVTRLTF